MIQAFVLRFVAVVLCATGASSMRAQASDIVTVKIHNLASSAQTEVPITFGQVFKPGDVPTGAEIVARRVSDGASIPLQVDKKATHHDGSLRHAVLTARLPRLGAWETLGLALAPSAHETSDPSVRLTDLLASSFSTRVALRLNGKTYTADARGSLRRASAGDQWLSGPLVSEWIVGGPLKDGSGNLHPHLAAYFHVRAYAGLDQVLVDTVIENGWTFVKNSADFTYDATIAVGGREVYTADHLKHHHHARWHKSFWWGNTPSVYVNHDSDYLQATGAVPEYLNLTPSETYLERMRQESVPMAHGDLTQYFPTTGAQDQIGPLPRWTALYIVTGDRRAFNSMLANDDSAGSYGVHYRDENTGRPISIADHPHVSISHGDYSPLVSVPSGENPNVPDDAHQPSIAFLSYLLTGNYYYLEEMQFWTSWNQFEYHSEYRQHDKGILGVQVRGQAWTFRNLGQAAYATPDNHPYKAHLVASVGHNLSYNETLYSSNPSANQLGALRSYDGHIEFSPWMDDFYTWSMGYLVDLGFDAVEMRNWKARFPVGRMGVTDYCYIHASAYRLKVGPDSDTWWPDFATLYRQNFGDTGDCPLGAEMEGYSDSPAGFPSNLRPALAAAVDARVPGAKAAWERLAATAVQPDYSDYPNWAVVPREMSVGLVDDGSGNASDGDGGNRTGGSGATDALSLLWLVVAAILRPLLIRNALKTRPTQNSW